jgi:hypothetical protein
MSKFIGRNDTTVVGFLEPGMAFNIACKTTNGEYIPILWDNRPHNKKYVCCQSAWATLSGYNDDSDIGYKSSDKKDFIVHKFVLHKYKIQENSEIFYYCVKVLDRDDPNDKETNRYLYIYTNGQKCELTSISTNDPKVYFDTDVTKFDNFDGYQTGKYYPINTACSIINLSDNYNSVFNFSLLVNDGSLIANDKCFYNQADGTIPSGAQLTIRCYMDPMYQHYDQNVRNVMNTGTGVIFEKYNNKSESPTGLETGINDSKDTTYHVGVNLSNFNTLVFLPHEWKTVEGCEINYNKDQNNILFHRCVYDYKEKDWYKSICADNGYYRGVIPKMGNDDLEQTSNVIYYYGNCGIPSQKMPDLHNEIIASSNFFILLQVVRLTVKNLSLVEEITLKEFVVNKKVIKMKVKMRIKKVVYQFGLLS